MCFYIFELYYIILIEKRRVERLGFSITKNPKYQRFTVLVKGSTIDSIFWLNMASINPISPGLSDPMALCRRETFNLVRL